MVKFQIYIVSLLATTALIFGAGCSSGGGRRSSSVGVATEVRQSGLVSESDSLAYIIGMNIAEQLQKMDSTINTSVLCRAIMEHFEGEAIMSSSQAREEYIRYLLHVDPERRRSYEEQFLSDLAANNRNFTRTKSGLTYHIAVIGDEKLTPKNTNDWVTIKYSISRIGGEQIIANRTESEALSDLMAGVEESVKLIGKGGKIEAWLPSKIAYGEEGDDELGVSQTETLLYSIELVDMEPKVAAERKKERDIANF